MSKTFNFSVWMIGTPEEQAAEAERQKLAMAIHTRAKMTEAERLVGRGKLLEETARQNLEQSRHKDKEARILAQNQLADALADQGRFAEAAETHTERHRRQYFRDIVKAIEMDDGEKCECPDSKDRIGETEIAVTPRYELAKIFSPVHNDLVSVIRCRKCGHTNARKPRSRLLLQQSALSQSEAMKRPSSTDAQIMGVQ